MFLLFNSVWYFLFLTIVFVIYWSVHHRFRVPLILVCSYFFYMCWDAKYILLIFSATIVTYLSALYIEKYSLVNKRICRLFLAISCMFCMGQLFVFKYLNFVISILNNICEVLFKNRIPNMTVYSLVLPVGISFFTFQCMSYVIDVYRGQTQPEHDFATYATYVSFFPQLVAGPIERSSNLIPQIEREKTFDYDLAVYGARLIVWGLLKKVAIADIAAKYVDAVYNNHGDYSGLSVVFAIMLFSLQIYCDFSGYTDMARGSAFLLGIRLMENFKSPYLSKSVKEFWTRWHISLSTWFRDYVYIPLGGSRCSKLRNCFNLVATFLISGLWHGASWHFVAWGGVHGLAQVVEKRVISIAKTKHKMVRNNTFSIIFSIINIIIIMCFISLAWVFFRAESLSDAVCILRSIFVSNNSAVSFQNILERKEIVILCINCTILLLYDYLQINSDDPLILINHLPKVVRMIIGYGLVADVAMIVLNGGGTNQFVYFQF